MTTFCDYFNAGTCRSCDLIELTDQDQLTWKETKLKNLLLPVFSGALDASENSPSLGFRNKVKLMVTGTLDHPVIGLLGENQLDQGRELLACPLHDSFLNSITVALPDFIRESKLAPYSITERKGELKGLILYRSIETDECYLRFILRSEEAVTRLKKFLPVLMSKFPSLKVVTANIQPVPHALLEGEKEIHLTDTKHLHHRMKNVEIRLGTKGFVQTNQRVATALYENAAEWVKATGIHKFTELFCGQGAFSFFCAGSISEGLGIEITPEAVVEANRSAEEKGLTQLRFLCADAGSVEKELTDYNPELILVNPPRKGLGEAVQLLRKQKSKFVVYSSCDAETLGRDLLQLKDLYQVKRVKLFDMFPHTSHFETLVLLQRL